MGNISLTHISHKSPAQFNRDIHKLYNNKKDDLPLNLKDIDKIYKNLQKKYLSKKDDFLIYEPKQAIPPKNTVNNITLAEEITPENINNLTEGAQKAIVVNAYERNIKAREKCIQHYGVKCFICNFDFEKIYGDTGRGFIHVHHITPLSQINDEYEVDPITDLRPVCPNCHAMIHKQNPAYSIEEIKKTINKTYLKFLEGESL